MNQLTKLAVAVLVFFAVFAAITYVKVNQYDLGEVVMNSLQAVVVAAGLALREYLTNDSTP